MIILFYSNHHEIYVNGFDGMQGFQVKTLLFLWSTNKIVDRKMLKQYEWYPLQKNDDDDDDDYFLLRREQTRKEMKRYKKDESWLPDIIQYMKKLLESLSIIVHVAGSKPKEGSQCDFQKKNLEIEIEMRLTYFQIYFVIL